MSKQFVAILAIVIVGLFGVFSLTKNSNDSKGNGTSNSSKISDHKEGSGKKGVTLIEYGDFQCPICKQYYPILKQVKQAYGDDITFQFRNYPLIQIHQHAFEAARAAEAAGNQGKFWEMHDLLYENQDTWANSQSTAPIFESYARQLKLDVEKFKSDMASEQVASVINADVSAAQSIGATGTPTFVLNGKKIDNNPTNVQGFKQLIDNGIAEAEASKQQ